MLPVYFWQVEVPHRDKGQFIQKCPLVPQINSLASRVRTTPETGHKAGAEKKPLCALLHQLLDLFINSVVCSKMLEEEHFLLTLTMQTDPSQVRSFPSALLPFTEEQIGVHSSGDSSISRARRGWVSSPNSSNWILSSWMTLTHLQFSWRKAQPPQVTRVH